EAAQECGVSKDGGEWGRSSALAPCRDSPPPLRKPVRVPGQAMSFTHCVAFAARAGPKRRELQNNCHRSDRRREQNPVFGFVDCLRPAQTLTAFAACSCGDSRSHRKEL